MPSRLLVPVCLGIAIGCSSAPQPPGAAPAPGTGTVSSPAGVDGSQSTSTAQGAPTASAGGAPNASSATSGSPAAGSTATGTGANPAGASSGTDTPAVLPNGFAACQPPPKGMVCIPGGPAVIGSDDHFPTEKPRHDVEVSTFYLDQHEVTNAEYEPCEKAGACKKDRQILFGWGEFMTPDRPVIATTWDHAAAFCKWAGKRLPTEAEWEKAARGGPEGRMYPWGDEPPTCERAQYSACKPETTLPVGSRPAGAYGVFDLAGNGYEWVADWESSCFRGCPGECGDDCFGLDPQGPCAGGPGCGYRKRHILKGGSWYWPGEMIRGSWRRLEQSNSGAHRLGFRCASSAPNLYTWPPLAVTDPPAAPPDPPVPSAATVAAFNDLVEDEDIFKVPLCTEGGGAKLHCREAFSYVTTNEPSQYVWAPYVKNLGGGYVGVGADQAYGLVALARSRWAWLFDYDPAVVRLHYIIRAVVLAYDTPEQFVRAFSKGQSGETKRLVGQSVTDPAEREATLKTLDAVREAVFPWYTLSLQPNPQTGELGWLRHPEQYQYIRKLFQQKRIAIIKGNLLTDKAVPSIGRAARKMGVTVRILYLSNADDQWDITEQYRKNVRALPFDERSVVLRTLLPRWRQRSPGAEPWDYLVHGGIEEQRRIVHSSWQRTWWFAKDARRGSGTESPYLLTYGLPAQTER